MVNFLIVGAFPDKKSKIIGGQVTACKNLFPNHLYNKKMVIKFDTTQVCNPPPSFLFRFFLSIKRMPKYFNLVFFNKPKKVIILISSGTSFLEKTIYVFIAKLSGSKTIIIPRSDLIIKQIKTNILYKIFFKLLLISTDKFIFQSESFLKAFPKLFKSNYCILPNCINIKKNYNISEKYSLPKVEINILFVGWLEPIKNLNLLFNSVNILKELLPHKKININIVGEGSQKNALEIMANDLKLNAKFYGWINNKEKLNQIYINSDCFCLTSIAEGFPNVILEAMYHGLPIISTKVGGLSYWLKEERNILFSENFDPYNLALNILKLFSSEDLFLSISKNNFEDSRRRFNCDSIAKNLKIILKENI